MVDVEDVIRFFDDTPVMVTLEVIIASRWDADEHPRGPDGKFVKIVGQLNLSLDEIDDLVKSGKLKNKTTLAKWTDPKTGDKKRLQLRIHSTGTWAVSQQRQNPDTENWEGEKLAFDDNESTLLKLFAEVDAGNDVEAVDVSSFTGGTSTSNVTLPTSGKKVQNLTNAIIYGKYDHGEVIATSDNGDVVTYDAKLNKIMINGKPNGKAEAYKKLKGIDGWTLGGDKGGNTAPPTTPSPVKMFDIDNPPPPTILVTEVDDLLDMPTAPATSTPTPPKIKSMDQVWNAVSTGDYDGMVIAEGRTSTGVLVSRYVVHGTGSNTTVAQETWSPTKNEWEPYKQMTAGNEWQVKLSDLKHSSLKTQPIEPKKADGVVPLDKFPPSLNAPKAPTPKPPVGVTATSKDISAVPFWTKNEIKKSFKDADVKWWTNSAIIYPKAQEQASKHGLTLSQVLAVMDESTTTKTSPSPFTDKVQKYLGTKKGKDHAYQLITAKGVTSKIASGTSSGTPKPPTTETVKFINSVAPIKTDADFKVLGVSGAYEMKTEMDKEYGDWTPTQKSALTYYTGSAYTGMNGCLRYPHTCTPSIQKRNAQAKAGMRPSTRDIKVSRNTNFAAFGLPGAGYHDGIPKLQARIGATMEEPGFLSTAVTASSTWGGNVRVEIDVPKGTPMAWVKPISEHPGENEMLLDSGLHYRIKEVLPPDPPSHPTLLVRLEVVEK